MKNNTDKTLPFIVYAFSRGVAPPPVVRRTGCITASSVLDIDSRSPSSANEDINLIHHFIHQIYSIQLTACCNLNIVAGR